MNENIEVLEEVLDVLEEEKRKIYNLINQNEFRIEEIDSYLKELSNREDEDFKVFSPRNVENRHREQIEADTSEKKKYEEENAEYHKKAEGLKQLIDKVNVVIGNLQIFGDKGDQIEGGRIIESDSVNDEGIENIKEEIADAESSNGDIMNGDNIDTESADENIMNEDNIDTEDVDEDIINGDNIDIENEESVIMDESYSVDDGIIERNNKFNLEKNHIAHQILNCVSYITPDAERAKIELTALSKKLME